jgi:hypothetical protein
MGRGQVSWLVNLPEGAPVPAFPTRRASGDEEPAQHLQWRDRSGLPPDSLRELCARHRDSLFSCLRPSSYGTSPLGVKRGRRAAPSHGIEIQVALVNRTHGSNACEVVCFGRPVGECVVVERLEVGSLGPTGGRGVAVCRRCSSRTAF